MKDLFRIRIILILAAVFFSVFAFNTHSGIAGDWIKLSEERFRINAGAFLPSFDTSLRVDSKTFGEGTEIDIEDDLDLDGKDVTFFSDAMWQLRRWFLFLTIEPSLENGIQIPETLRWRHHPNIVTIHPTSVYENKNWEPHKFIALAIE